MPPKKQPASNKKTEAKKKEKIIEDKTFGLKNKKGAKQQKFIQQVEKQVKSGGFHPLTTADIALKKAEKEKKAKEQQELLMMMAKPVATQKVDKGADPKSVLCAFFKQGQCAKGDRCKFSHDLTVERKSEKRSVYVDMRDDEDNMDNWNEEKLKEVVDKKQGMAKNIPTTDIICKHFLDAVEKSKYGWFWECPSGAKCIYRHALPPGFVLKKDKKKLEEKKNDISLVDLIERERAALGSKQTKITLETFLAWKKRKLQEKKDQKSKEEEQKRVEYRAGRNIGLSGREMFSFNPNLANDDNDEDDGQALDSTLLQRDAEEEDDDAQYKELQLDLITLEATEADNSGTIAKEDRLHDEKPKSEIITNGNTDSMSSDPQSADTGPINESLFLDDDLDEELQNLDLDK